MDVAEFNREALNWLNRSWAELNEIEKEIEHERRNARMKIAICIPTKHRGIQLIAALTAYDQLSSGKHEISYHIGIDDGDEESYEAATLIQRRQPTNISIIPERILTIGGIWNYLAEQAPDADAICAMPDDVIPLLRYWDDALVHYLAPQKALSWHDSELGNMAGYPVVSREWISAAGLCSEWFPFWFCDTWSEEVYQFTFGRRVLMPPNLAVAGKRGPTLNLRDLDFWWGFFNSTRRIRINKAYELSRHFGAFTGTFQEFVKARAAYIGYAIRRDEEYRGNIPALEKNRQDMRDPSEKYLQAKANAETFMNERGMGLWECVTVQPETALAAE